MLNLILGEDLLPFSVLSTTSTICELKYGRDRRIKVHYKEEGKDPKIKSLDESSSYMDQISEFVHVKSACLREKSPQYKKVELFWPHSLLKVRNILCLENINIWDIVIIFHLFLQPCFKKINSRVLFIKKIMSICICGLQIRVFRATQVVHLDRLLLLAFYGLC